jgi:hypothetical protein
MGLSLVSREGCCLNGHSRSDFPNVHGRIQRGTIPLTLERIRAVMKKVVKEFTLNRCPLQ